MACELAHPRRLLCRILHSSRVDQGSFTPSLSRNRVRDSLPSYGSCHTLIFGDALVFGSASNARISGNARVGDKAIVSGNAWVSEDAWCRAVRGCLEAPG